MAIYESKYTRTQIDVGIGAGYVPTLQAAPTSSTTSYTRSDLPSGSQTVSFVVGQMCRVAVTGGYDFYQLKDVTNGTATWEKTNYSVMGASGSGHASGLVPDPGSTAGATKFLREDGTWQVPAADVSGKEDKMSIVMMDSVISSLSPAINTLYMVAASTLDVTLPTITDTTKVQSFVIMSSFGGIAPSITIHGTRDNICEVYMPTDISLEQHKIYEINCMFLGQYTTDQFIEGQDVTLNIWSVAIRDIGEANLG